MGMTLFMEAFVTIHMSVFVLLPLSKLISKDNSRKIFWTLFGVRIAILLFFDFFITTGIAIVDFQQPVVFPFFRFQRMKLLRHLHIELFILPYCDKVDLAAAGFADIDGITSAAKLQVHDIL